MAYLNQHDLYVGTCWQREYNWLLAITYFYFIIILILFAVTIVKTHASCGREFQRTLKRIRILNKSGQLARKCGKENTLTCTSLLTAYNGQAYSSHSLQAYKQTIASELLHWSHALIIQLVLQIFQCFWAWAWTKPRHVRCNICYYMHGNLCLTHMIIICFVLFFFFTDVEQLGWVFDDASKTYTTSKQTAASQKTSKNALDQISSLANRTLFLELNN